MCNVFGCGKVLCQDHRTDSNRVCRNCQEQHKNGELSIDLMNDAFHEVGKPKSAKIPSQKQGLAHHLMCIPCDLSTDLDDYIEKDTDDPKWSVAVGTAVCAPIMYGRNYHEKRKCHPGSTDDTADPNIRKWLATNGAAATTLCAPGIVVAFYPHPSGNLMTVAMPYIGRQIMHITVACSGWLYERTANYRDRRIQLGNMVLYRNLVYNLDGTTMTLQQHIDYRMNKFQFEMEGKRFADEMIRRITKEHQKGMIIKEPMLPNGIPLMRYKPVYVKKLKEKSMIHEYELLHDATIELVSMDGYKKEMTLIEATTALNLDARKNGKSGRDLVWDSRKFSEHTPDRKTFCTIGDHAYTDLFWNLVSTNMFHNMYEIDGRRIDPPNNIGPIGIAKICALYLLENHIGEEWVQSVHHWATEIYSNAKGMYCTLTGDMLADSFLRELWDHPIYTAIEKEYFDAVAKESGDQDANMDQTSTGRLFKGIDLLVLTVLRHVITGLRPHRVTYTMWRTHDDNGAPQWEVQLIGFKPYGAIFKPVSPLYPFVGTRPPAPDRIALDKVDYFFVVLDCRDPAGFSLIERGVMPCLTGTFVRPDLDLCDTDVLPFWNAMLVFNMQSLRNANFSFLNDGGIAVHLVPPPSQAYCDPHSLLQQAYVHENGQ